MPGTPTTYMNLIVPTVGGDSNAWGGYINTDLISIDLLAIYNIVPVNSSGALAIYNGPAVIKATGGGSGITTTLPDATIATNLGRTYIIVKIDGGAGAITVNTTGGQTISGASSFTISSQWSRLGVVSDGANWIAINPVEVLNPGTVTSFSAGTLSPVFTTSVATSTTTPALSFVLSNAGAHQYLGNNTGISAAPSYVQPSFTDLAGSIAIGQTPLTTLGDTLYVNTSPALTRLAGNTTTQKQYLSQTGTGVVSAAPVWAQINAADLSNGTTGTGAIVLANGPSLTSTVTMTGTFSVYNNIATVGQGISAEVAVVDRPSLSAAIPATTIYTPTASGMFRISWSADITAADAGSPPSSTLGPFQVLYTSPTDSVVKTTVAGSADSSAANTTGTALGGTKVVYAKAGQPIQYQMGYSSAVGSPPSLMVYELHLKVESL